MRARRECRKRGMLMKLLLPIASAICILANGCAAASPPTGRSAAPSVRCELRLSAWCIEEGAYEITRQLADDSIHDRFWLLRGRFRPESKLVILEPNGCRTGFSDALKLLKFEHGVHWKSRSWDRLQARLKSDGTCDLTILLSPYDGDQMEWAFTEGVSLVRPCKDDVCAGAGLVQLKAQFEQKFRELAPQVEQRKN